jgi:hypothetical protein
MSAPGTFKDVIKRNRGVEPPMCVSTSVQQRVRRAVQHTIRTNEMRTFALNRWLEA